MLVGERLMESSKLKYLHKYVTEKHSSLALPIIELNDARRVMLCMEDVDNNLMDLDRDIEHINKLFDLLVDYKINITRDETRLGILNETYRLLKTKVRYDQTFTSIKYRGEGSSFFETKVLNDQRFY